MNEWYKWKSDEYSEIVEEFFERTEDPEVSEVEDASPARSTAGDVGHEDSEASEVEHEA